MTWSKIYHAEEQQPECQPLSQWIEGYDDAEQEGTRVFAINKDGDANYSSQQASGEAPNVNLSGRKPSRKAPRKLGPKEAEFEGLVQEARRRLEEANRNAEHLEKEAYEKGFEQGEKAGRQLGEQKLEVSVRNIGQLLEQLATIHQILFEREQERLIQIAYKIAEKVVHHEVQAQPETVTQIAEAVLQKTVQEKLVTLHVNPQDIEIIEQHKQENRESKLNSDSLLIKADPNVQRGGCIAHTPDGEINATLDTQLKHIRNELLGE